MTTAEELTKVQIAERLTLSENTVKCHVQHLFRKLGVENRTEAALRHTTSGRVPRGPTPG